MARHADTQTVCTCLNECLAILRRNAGTPPEEAGWFQTGPVRAIISREDAPQWHALIADACEIPSLRLVSKRFLEQAVLESLSELPEEAAGVSRNDAEAFIRRFVGVATEYTVHRPVWGLTCVVTSAPLQLGRVTFYNRETYQSPPPIAAMARAASSTNAGSVPGVWALVTVMAHDENRAIEMADEVFEQLEAVLNCLLPANGSELKVSILTPNTAAIGPCQVDSATASHFGVRSHGQLQSICIDHEWFRNPSSALTRLVALVGNGAANSSLENDVLYAVQWCAKSCTTEDPTTAFIQATVAMEVLIGSPIFGKGGISGRMAVNAAHLLGDTVDQAEKIEALVSKCYRLRSEGVHGGDKQPDLIRELRNWQHVVTQVILRILETGDAAMLKSLADVAQELRRRTYRYKGLGPKDA